MQDVVARALRVPVFRFVLSGVCGVGSYYLIYWGLITIGIRYDVSAIPAFMANNVSNFLFHKFWTFENRDLERLHRQLIWYACMVGLFFFANIGLLVFFVEVAGMGKLGAQVLVTAVVSAVSYFTTRWVFR